MTDKIEISKRDVKAIQLLYWVITGISMMIVTIFMLFDFNSNTACIWFLCFALNGTFQYLNTKIWNIWYKDKNLYFQNIYKTNIREIQLFKKIEMTSPLGTYYKFFLTNGESFNFGLNPTEDLKLFFKTDPQFYAKKMTNMLNGIKQNPSK
jgi:hypothetical protein